MAYHESGSGPMEANFGPELEARIRHSAARLGREPEELAREVLTRYFEEEARFVDAVRRGEESFERAGYLTHEQVGEGLHRFLQA